MIINSRYTDYYDSTVRSMGIDKTMVFNRDISTVYLKDIYRSLTLGLMDKLVNCRAIDYNSRWNKTNQVHILPVVFCGKVYWINGLKNEHFVYGEDERVVYEPLVENIKISKYRWDKDATNTELVSQYDMTELNIALNSSIVVLFPSNNRTPDASFRDIKFMIYPQLKQFNFQKIVDPYTAYQEIQMFNFGILSTTTDPEPLNDTSRIVAAGFDLKTSFRNIK